MHHPGSFALAEYGSFEGDIYCPLDQRPSIDNKCPGLVGSAKSASGDYPCTSQGDGQGPYCWSGSFPYTGGPCCATTRDKLGLPKFDNVILNTNTTCKSVSILPIVNNLCLHKSECKIYINDTAPQDGAECGGPAGVTVDTEYCKFRELFLKKILNSVLFTLLSSL